MHNAEKIFLLVPYFSQFLQYSLLGSSWSGVCAKLLASQIFLGESLVSWIGFFYHLWRGPLQIPPTLSWNRCLTVIRVSYQSRRLCPLLLFFWWAYSHRKNAYIFVLEDVALPSFFLDSGLFQCLYWNDWIILRGSLFGCYRRGECKRHKILFCGQLLNTLHCRESSSRRLQMVVLTISLPLWWAKYLGRHCS